MRSRWTSHGGRRAETPTCASPITIFIKEAFIDYDGEKVFLTENAKAYCKEIYESINEDRTTSLDKAGYKKLLDKYFVI